MSEQEHPKYRIKVEVIGGSGEKLESDYTDGIECGGFVIIGMNEDSCKTAIHHASIMNIAHAIAGDDDIVAASILAKGMLDARKYAANSKMKGVLSKLALDGLNE